MGSFVYNSARAIGAPFRYRLAGTDNLPLPGTPAIYVSNHLKEAGPISIMLSFPERLYPWTISDMMEKDWAPKYLLDDFVAPTLGIKGKAGLAFSTLLSKLTVQMLDDLGAIPVNRNNRSLMGTFYKSMNLLMEGKSLLIFPEDPLQEPDPSTGIRPFLDGFAYLGHLYGLAADKPLGYYPLAVEQVSRTIQIGGRDEFSLNVDKQEAMHGLSQRLEAKIMEMYICLRKHTGS